MGAWSSRRMTYVRCRLIFMGYQRGSCSYTSGVQNFEVVSRFLENVNPSHIWQNLRSVLWQFCYCIWLQLEDGLIWAGTCCCDSGLVIKSYVWLLIIGMFRYRNVSGSRQPIPPKRKNIHRTVCLFVFWRDSTPIGPGPPHSRGFYITHDAKQSVGLLRANDSWSQRLMTTHNTYNKHPCPRWNSNAQSQQASGHRPTL